ncbi:hypothetical protein THAOC_07757, partial [Thalassiosira oceanica]
SVWSSSGREAWVQLIQIDYLAAPFEAGAGLLGCVRTVPPNDDEDGRHEDMKTARTEAYKGGAWPRISRRLGGYHTLPHSRGRKQRSERTAAANWSPEIARSLSSEPQGSASVQKSKRTPVLVNRYDLLKKPSPARKFKNEIAGPWCGIRGGGASTCSQGEWASAELSAAPLWSTIGSHVVLRVASFLARFWRPRAFFPLGIAAMLRRDRQQLNRLQGRAEMWRRNAFLAMLSRGTSRYSKDIRYRPAPTGP